MNLAAAFAPLVGGISGRPIGSFDRFTNPGDLCLQAPQMIVEKRQIIDARDGSGLRSRPWIEIRVAKSNALPMGPTVVIPAACHDRLLIGYPHSYRMNMACPFRRAQQPINWTPGSIRPGEDPDVEAFPPHLR